jgi:hypothetical protein
MSTTFHLDVYKRLDRLGTVVRTTAYDGPDADVIEGTEHGEVEYALTKSEWHAGAAAAASS